MSLAPPANQDALIAELSGLTGLGTIQAEQYLNASGWDIQTAAALFFDAVEPSDEAAPVTKMAEDNKPQQSTPNPPSQSQPGGGRTLDGTYVPPSEPSASSSRQSRSAPRQRGLRTLGDLQSSGGGHSHAHDDGEHGDDSDYNDDENQDFFAGGEKSGLAVQNPNQANPRDQINNILRRARQNAPRPGGDEESSATHFQGTGMTLGGDDAPSRSIPDPTVDTPQPAPRVHRELHLWRDGFSVDDGDLYRYDDPANSRTLEMINTGHAPLNILNVEQGQEVDVQVHAHKDEDFVKPKKKYVPFSGAGQRLGSPTPGASTFAAPPSATATQSTTNPTASSNTAQPSVTVDSSAPTVTLQIRLGDGTRLSSRFNTTHTIGDVYSFVDASRPNGRSYVLMTTFPSKELADKAQVIGDMSDFKRGGVVVQKWK